MARWLGVRAPSKPFSMTWDGVDWGKSLLRIPSPKTEAQGKPYGIGPILPPCGPA